jgi:hypothetical protein
LEHLVGHGWACRLALAPRDFTLLLAAALSLEPFSFAL